jgi:hypothetical protein
MLHDLEHWLVMEFSKSIRFRSTLFLCDYGKVTKIGASYGSALGIAPYTGLFFLSEVALWLPGLIRTPPLTA